MFNVNHTKKFFRIFPRWILLVIVLFHGTTIGGGKIQSLGPRDALAAPSLSAEKSIRPVEAGEITRGEELEAKKKRKIKSFLRRWSFFHRGKKVKARIQQMFRQFSRDDKALLTAIKPILEGLNKALPVLEEPKNKLLHKLYAFVQERRARVFIDPTLLAELSKQSQELKKTLESYEEIVYHTLVACTVDAELGHQLTQFIELDKWVEVISASFPGHTALLIRKGGYFLIFDPGLEHVSEIYTFDETYEKAGQGDYYVLRDYLEALDQGPEPTKEFLRSHPLKAYFFFYPHKVPGFQSSILSNSATSYLSLFEATGEMAYIERGITFLKQALQLDPNDAGIYSNFGSAYYRNLLPKAKNPDNLNKVLSFFERAVELNPFDAALHSNLGVYYHDLFKMNQNPDDLTKSLNSLKRAIQLDPSFGGAYTNLGVSYLSSFEETGEPNFLEEAIRNFEIGRELLPNDFKLHNDFGLAYKDLFSQTKDPDDFEKAISSFKKAIHLAPLVSVPYSNLGNTYNDLFQVTHDKMDLAMDVYLHELATLLNPDNAKLMYNLGLAQYAFYQQTHYEDLRASAIENFVSSFILGLESEYLEELTPEISRIVKDQLQQYDPEFLLGIAL